MHRLFGDAGPENFGEKVEVPRICLIVIEAWPAVDPVVAADAVLDVEARVVAGAAADHVVPDHAGHDVRAVTTEGGIVPAPSVHQIRPQAPTNDIGTRSTEHEVGLCAALQVAAPDPPSRVSRPVPP